LKAGQDSQNPPSFQSIAALRINNSSTAADITKMKIMSTILFSAPFITVGNHTNMKISETHTEVKTS
jgi:hypothetical protein